MRSRWFLSMARWRVWSPVAWKAGAGALAAWETAWTLIPWVSRDGRGLTWITISVWATGHRQCKPGRVRIRLQISVTSVSVTKRGETFPIVNVSRRVLWVAQICRTKKDPRCFIRLLSLHTEIWGHKGDLNVGICISCWHNKYHLSSPGSQAGLENQFRLES